jgi:hypothetical protein
MTISIGLSLLLFSARKVSVVGNTKFKADNQDISPSFSASCEDIMQFGDCSDDRFIIVGYEKETFGTSMLYPDIPEGRNKCLHRFTHVAFWFEWSEYQ